MYKSTYASYSSLHDCLKYEMPTPFGYHPLVTSFQVVLIDFSSSVLSTAQIKAFCRVVDEITNNSLSGCLLVSRVQVHGVLTNIDNTNFGIVGFVVSVSYLNESCNEETYFAYVYEETKMRTNSDDV